MHCLFSFLILACAACYSHAIKKFNVHASTCPIDEKIIEERRWIFHVLKYFTDGSRFSYLTVLNEAGKTENEIQLKASLFGGEKFAQLKLEFSQLNVAIRYVMGKKVETVKYDVSSYTWPKATTTFNVSFERVGSEIKLMVNDQQLWSFDFPESKDLTDTLVVFIRADRLNVTSSCYFNAYAYTTRAVVNEVKIVSTESPDTTFKAYRAQESTCPINKEIIGVRRWINHQLGFFNDGSKFSYSTLLNEAGDDENVIQLINDDGTIKLAQFKLKFSKLKVSLTDVTEEEASSYTYGSIGNKAFEFCRTRNNSEGVTFRCKKVFEMQYKMPPLKSNITHSWPKATTTFNVSIERVGSKIKLMVNEQLLWSFKYPNKGDLPDVLQVNILGPRLNINSSCYLVKEVSTESLNTTCKVGNEKDCNKLDIDETEMELCSIYRNSEIMYTRLPNGFTDGKMLSINATVNENAERFTLDIVDRDFIAAFRLEVEPKKNSIVLSYEKAGNWTDQAKSPNLWFKPKQAFELVVYREGEYFLVYVNSHSIARFEIPKRRYLRLATFFRLLGNITAKSACYKDSNLPPLPEFNSDSMLHENCEHKWDNRKLYEVPYTKLPMVLTSNHSIIIHVTPYVYKNKFVIDFFHNNKHNWIFRLKDNGREISVDEFSAGRKVIRNKPLMIDEPAKLEILNTGKYFEVFLNGSLLGRSPKQNRDPDLIRWYGNGLVSGLCLK